MPGVIELLRDIESEHGVPVELLCAALEEALRDAYRAHIDEGEIDVIASVDRASGEIAVIDRRVVAEVPVNGREIALADAPAGYQPGDYLDDPVDVTGLARVAARAVLPTLKRRILEHKREAVFALYRPRQGTIVRGLVQRVVDGDVYVALEYDIEAVLPRDERAPGDVFAINDTLDAELLAVAKAPHGPMLVLSRSRASYVRALLPRPEIVLAAARRPGFVTVLASNRNTLANDVATMLARVPDERIQIIRWEHDPAEMIVQLMPEGTGEVFAVAEHRLVIVEGENVTPLQLELARQLCPGWGVRVAAPGASDAVLEEHLAAVAAAPDENEIDPEVVRRLEAYARERDEAEDA